MSRSTAPIHWMPGPDRVRESRLTHFAEEYGDGRTFRDLHRWSITHPADFWTAVWEFTDVVSEKGPRPDGAPALEGMAGPMDPERRPRWFPAARLNFAENLLQAPDEAEALIAWNEDGRRAVLTFRDLRHEAARFAEALRTVGVGPGDRVAGFLPNLPETVIAFLGTATVGAVWSSCSPDFGTAAVVDRFGQIEPRVLVTATETRYKRRPIDLRQRVEAVVDRLPSVETVVQVGGGESVRDFTGWEAFLAMGGPGPSPEGEGLVPRYERLPFDHPLAILYSSGTTGLPKCIVHSAGGTLLQHRKEHALHLDLRAGERFFYFTTCGWMMWNWLVTGLAEGAALVLYDGAPAIPAPGVEPGARSLAAPDILWALAEEEGVHHLGVSAKYLALMEKEGVRPGAHRSLDALRTILSTGSPLAPGSFDWVYQEVKADVHLASISGGTDIVSCFVLGLPTEPVRRGEIQGPGLGMAVEVWGPQSAPDAGRRRVGEAGELVCTRPFPSMPLSFWNDPDHARFRRAYFDVFPGVWRHGDWAEETESGGYRIHGRSDATLNPGGVRMGTAEIYRVVEAFDEVLEAVAVAQEVPGGEAGDVRIVLLLRLREGARLGALTNSGGDTLEGTIRRRIREELSPHHVPRVVTQVDDLPRTISGKLSEMAVREALHGRPVTNREALANPEALDALAARVDLRLPPALVPLLGGMVDYAGLFPPSALSMAEAVRNHAAYLSGPDRWALGRFVLPAGRILEFREAVEPFLQPHGPTWDLSVLVGPDPAREVEEVLELLRWGQGRIRVGAVETRLGSPEEAGPRVAALEPLRTSAQESNPPGEATSNGAASAPDGETSRPHRTSPLEIWLEVPVLEVGDDPHRMDAFLTAIRDAGALAKIRTGGVRSELFPPPDVVTLFMERAQALGLRFKATAGLHHVIWGYYPLTYEPEAPRANMSGYLNVFLAAAVLQAGGDRAEARAALLERDPARLRADEDGLHWGSRHIAVAELTRLRTEGIAGFGSCSLREPVDELKDLLDRSILGGTRTTS